MNLSLMLALVAILIAAAGAVPQRNSGSGGDCAFGKEYFDGCNRCVCHGKSGSTCTRMPSCTTTSTAATAVGIVKVGGGNSRPSYSRRVCPRGEEYLDDCNVCTCHGERGYICTSKECYKPPSPGSTSVKGSGSSSVAKPTESNERCIVGHQYYRGCEICTCFGEYFGYRCSRSGKCDTTTSFPNSNGNREAYRPASSGQNAASPNTCPRGYSYNDGYYYCVCRKDRKGYVCTHAVAAS